jgi:hypothetical protein
MASILKVDTIQDQAGNNIISEAANVITIGASGDTITVPAGATVSGFTSAGIDDNATSVAITIDSNENVGIGTTSPNNYSGYGNLTLNGTSGGIFDLEVNGTRTGTLLGLVGETRLASITNIPVTFQVNNAEKMRLTSNGLGIGTSNPSATVGTDNVLEVAGSVSPGLVINDTGQAEKYQLYADSTKFKMNYGSTNFLTYDASNSNLGLGTTSPGRTLDVAGIVRSSTAFALGGNTSTPSEGSAIYRPASDNLAFVTNNNERARFDGSGNLFVAKTSAAYQTVGHELLASGRAFHTANGGKTLSLNRLTNDGAIVDFYRNGTEIGSIETVGVSTSGRLVVKSTTFDGYLDRAGTTIAKWMSSSFTPGADNTFDLGRGAERWQDIYLSGGAYLGGTGSSNQLSDYEEGTWSPAITTDGGGGNSGVTYGDRYGTYTKIGRIVTVHVFCNLDAVSTFGTGNAIISTLPFSSNSASQYRSGVVIGYAKNWNNAPSGGTISTNANTIYLRKRNSTSALSNFTDVVQVGDMNTNSEIILTATYETD